MERRLKFKAIFAVLILVGAMLIAGCSKDEKTLVGAVVGTAAGAGIGSAVGGTGGAIAGGALGGVTGGVIGRNVK